MSSVRDLLINTPPLLADVDHLSLDNRKFDPSRDDIEGICRFFSIGKLRHHEKEKGIIVSHSNFFVFAATTRGQYALKFYPPDAAKAITVEYAINRTLTHHHYLTPVMHAGAGGQPFLASNGRLAACYSYIDGLPAWQCIKQRGTIQQINTAMLSLKNILSTTWGHIPLQKQASLAAAAGKLSQDSRSVAPYSQKQMMDQTLQDACLAYRRHEALFTRQKLHNNTSLTNFLIFKKNVYTLDLSHIREDYSLSDLASLVISCVFFNIPITTIRAVAKDYFIQHQLKPGHFLALNTLVKMGLAREYLQNIQREKSVEGGGYPQNLLRTYLFHISKRKKSITAALKKITGSPRLII